MLINVLCPRYTNKQHNIIESADDTCLKLSGYCLFTTFVEFEFVEEYSA